MSEIKIFVTHTPNQEKECVQHPLYYNIIAGSDFQKENKMNEMLYDNTGQNISFKNKSYCELTTQYWAWKNQKADYYGFCHYRRYFSFSKENFPEEDCGCLIYSHLDRAVQKKLNFDENAMKKIIENYDFLIAKGIDTRSLLADNVYQHYEKAPELNIHDLDVFQTIIKEFYPELAETAEHYLAGKKFYPCNMFIMNKELFNEYSEMLFRILEEFERRVDMKYYSREGYRTPGHLGERFVGIYYEYLKKKGGYRLKELQIALIENTDKEIDLTESSEENTIPVIFAANQDYIAILYTCILSLILHSDRKRKYNIYILHTDIELQSQKNFQKELQRENIKIIFLDVSWRIEGYRLKAKQHITSETYYRFLILDIFKNYNKVLYLDCDMIICKDVAELYDIDLEDKWLGAVVDPDFAGQCNGANVDTANYVKDVLKLENPFRYFQAGVLILNPKTLNSNVSMQQLFEMSEDDKYMYSDQDILNIVCENNVKYLDMKWNLLPDARNRWRNVIKYAPYYILDEYESARKEPYIIHYAGDTKPWKNPGEDYAPEFWKVAKQTEYYEVLIQKIEKPKEKHISFLENFKISIKNSVKRMLPKDSKIRKIIFTLYWKMK